MGRWLPAILLFGLTTRCSCAEEPDNAYPGNTQNKALKAWMTQNRPDLLENYQEEGLSPTAEGVSQKRFKALSAGQLKVHGSQTRSMCSSWQAIR